MMEPANDRMRDNVSEPIDTRPIERSVAPEVIRNQGSIVDGEGARPASLAAAWPLPCAFASETTRILLRMKY